MFAYDRLNVARSFYMALIERSKKDLLDEGNRWFVTQRDIRDIYNANNLYRFNVFLLLLLLCFYDKPPTLTCSMRLVIVLW